MNNRQSTKGTKFRKSPMQQFIDKILFYVFLLLLFGTNINSPAQAVSGLNQFDKAPELVLPKQALPSESMDLHKFAQPVILIFGEPYHQKTLESLKEFKKVYSAVSLAEADMPVFLVVSQRPTQEQMTELRKKENIIAEILMDENRKAFGDYGVIVLPSIVVTDKEGRIVLSLSGVPFFFSDIIEDAILMALGRITPQQHEASISAAQQTNSPQESAKRARHLAGLAGQLMRRNYTQLALQRYREALELDNTYLQARVGMARCFIKLNILPNALEQVQKVLQADANNVEATIIMSQAEIMQGGQGVTAGKEKLQRILTLYPAQPEANYLMGRVYEIQGETDRALSSYKKAAEMLLETDKY